MKKFGIILAAVLLVAAAALHFMQGRKGAVSADEVAAYVPQDALIMSSQTNLKQVSDTFTNSPLGRFFAKETMHAIMEELAAAPETIQAYDQWYDSVANTMKNPLFRTVFGDDMTVAVLPPNTDLLKENPEQAFRRALLVYATTSTASAAEILGSLAKGVTIEKEQTDGLELTKIQLNSGDGGKETIYGYNAAGVVLLALDKAPVIAGVQAREADNSLKAQTAYQEANDFWQRESQATIYSRNYFNIAGLAALLPHLEQSEGMQEAVAYLQGLDYGYDITVRTPQGLHNKARVKLQHEQLHDLFKTMVDESAAGVTVPLSLVNDKTLFFQWGYSFKPEALLKLTAQADPEGYAAMQQEAQELLGIPIEDAASSFGPRYGLILNDIVETGIFPLPDLAFFTNVRNRNHVQALATALNQQVAVYGLTGEQQQLTNNTLLFSWPVMTEIGLVPALGLNDSLAFLGTMQGSMQPLLVDQKQPGEALPADITAQLGPDLSSKLGKANGGVFLLRSARLAEKSQSTLDLFNSLAGPSIGVNFNRLGQEVLKLMQATELVAGTTNINKDAIDWDTLWIPVAATPAAAAPVQPGTKGQQVQ
ncbi:MAG: hypothetical protein GX087_06690 [Desulfobulbaceae bacterium]|nr:hypothetical protein [Desulfobulbaceae bacterium]